jgi:predicted oxidoreductase
MLTTQSLGASDLKVTKIAYGCMPLGGSWDTSPLTEEAARKAIVSIRAALDAGINFYDHADIYCRGKSEEAFSRIWDEVPSLREKIVVQSKVGIRFDGTPHATDPGRYDFSYEHIMQTVEDSLRRLRTEYLDVLLLHRPDVLVEPEEVAKAFDELHQSGKVRWFGVSNETAAQIDLLRAYVKQPIVCNQVAFNVIHTHMLSEGANFNQDTSMLTRNHGTIEYCRQHNITLQAWAPLANGQLTGRSLENAPSRIIKTAELVAQFAREKNVGGEAILIAWVLRHPAKIQAIIGTTQPARIAAACQGDGITLTREEWYRLYIAGRGEDLA